MKERESDLEQCYLRMEKGEAPSDEIETAFQREMRDEMRRRRNEVTVEIRKNKRDETLQKRRNVTLGDVSSTSEEETEKTFNNNSLEMIVQNACS